MANQEQPDNIGKSLQARTDAKLRYAKIHLDELAALPIRNGDDFDRAHQESFLFHLFGVRDAFLAELNHYYRCGLPQHDLTVGKLRNVLKARCCGLQISDTRLANSGCGGLTFRANSRGCRLTLSATGLALRAHSLQTSAWAHIH
jgi:hypothetical protein